MQQQLERGASFETEVRRIARLLWPSPAHQGAKIIGGRERDGIFETDDAIHVLEATTLRTKQKAETDTEKTASLVLELRKLHPEKSVRGWFVTRDDLTADQLAAATKYKGTVNAIPFKDFLAKLIDARQYLSFREKASFGSVADPVTNHYDYPRDSYVPAIFYSETDKKDIRFSDFFHSSNENASRAIVLGDFGAGKSMAMREAFYRAASDFYSGKSSRFPVYLNLRNHIGQDDPVEALIREANSVGYARYDEIVKAWRADLLVLILDGFDELLTPGWSQKVSHMKEHRSACTALIANFLKESPLNTPIIIAGRFSYFGSNAEMKSAFRIHSDVNVFRVNNFTSEQAVQLLRKMNVSSSVPEWLPSRPLLLGYIASYAASKGVDLTIEDVDPAEGWDHLLDRICEREADIQRGLYPEFIRKLLERIATKARYSHSILSPISQAEIGIAFKEVFGRDPDNTAIGMLMRLPGLVAAESQRDDRRFIDPDMANACASGDVYSYAIDASGTDFSHFESCRTNIDELAVDLILSKLGREGRQEGALWAAFERSSRMNGIGVLKGDVLSIVASSSISEKDRWITIDDVVVDRIDLRSAPTAFKKIRIAQGLLSRVEVDLANTDGLPHFTGCVIDILSGPPSIDSVRKWFGDSDVGSFENQELTNNAILDLDIPKGLKVGLTALRKLYLQPGGGRQANSFYRGLSADLRPVIDEVLGVMCSHGYARISTRTGSEVYLKSSDKTSEVLTILNERGAAKGSLVEDFRRIH